MGEAWRNKARHGRRDVPLEEQSCSEYNELYKNQNCITIFFFQDHNRAKSKSEEGETVSSVKQGEVQQGNFKKALETIVFIMNGSIDAGTTLNLDSEASTSSNSESSIDLNSQTSSEVDSDTVSDPYLETTNTDLDSEKSEDLTSQTCSILDSSAHTSLKSTVEFVVKL